MHVLYLFKSKGNICTLDYNMKSYFYREYTILYEFIGVFVYIQYSCYSDIRVRVKLTEQNKYRHV